MLDVATKSFRKKVRDQIVDKTFETICQGETREITISSRTMIKNHLSKVCPDQIDAKKFVEHFEALEPFVAFSSSIESFTKLGSMQFTTEKKIPYLDKHQVEELRKSGARLHTLREKNDMVFDTRQRGVQFGDSNSSSVSGLIRTIGSKSGKYEDKFPSSSGFFLYEPPCQQSGMLRFRWVQFLKQKHYIPIFFILVRWFGLKSPIPDRAVRRPGHAQKGKMAFMIIPVTVVTSEVQKENRYFFSTKGQYSDLTNIGRSIERPLPLQLIEPEECFQIIYNLKVLNSQDLQFKNRLPLNPRLSADYNYDALISTELEKKLERWAKDTGKRCPDGSKCGNKRFADQDIGELHIGHIISQNWCKVFKFGEKFMNHPYNLYLSCGSCNESLNKRFPHNDLQNRLDDKKATIGDWAIQFDSAIRNTRI